MLLGNAAQSQTLNRYAYVGGNPVGYVDPSGNCPWCVSALVGAFVGAGVNITGQLINDGNWRNIKVEDVGWAAASGLMTGVLGFGAMKFIPEVSYAVNTIGGGLVNAGLTLAKNEIHTFVDPCSKPESIANSAIGGAFGGLGGRLITRTSFRSGEIFGHFLYNSSS